MSRKALVVVIASLGLAPACGVNDMSEYRHFGQRIINGSLDNTNNAVVILYNTAVGALCTGTLITNDVVLTAAHCVESDPYMRNCNRPVSASSMRVGFGVYESSATWRNVSELRQHPNWDCDNLVNDITMLRLSSAPPSGVTPIPYLPSTLAVTSNDVGAQLEFSGYGQTETGSTGTRLHVSNALDLVCTSASGCGGYASQNTICYDENPGGPCSGDSGGPAFLLRSGTKYVAGVTSYGDQNCTQFGCSTKVDAFESFITDFIGTSLPLGSTCSAGTQCQSGFCVDSVCCENSCASACQSCNLAASRGYCRADPDNTPCPDSNLCNGTEVCRSGSCTAGTALNCDDGSICTTDACNPSTGCTHTPANNGASCDDRNVCNGQETCQNGTCLSQNPLNCDDGNGCTADACDSISGCLHTQLPDSAWCSDNNACNGLETCRGGVCQPGNPLDCNDFNPCTLDTCNPGSGCVRQNIANGSQCDDGNLCNGADACLNGTCLPTGAGLACDDHNPCTTDSCDPVLGCRNAPVADGTNCGGGLCGTATCKSGACVPTGSVNCDDDNACTIDSCSTDVGCIHIARPDGYECGDCVMCLAGTCSAEVPDCKSGGCGCGTTDGAGAGGLVMLLFASFLRRKRS